jgi:glycosyltransferase involved in cell wall biosynthesis/2-polyprenyl-3-methyl-5-hydroxy-6-metoxy-1,4-benzoquinol methylase
VRSEERETPVVVAELAGSAGHGGGERYLELLIERLDRARFQPILICPEPGPFVEIMRGRGIPTTMVHLAPLINPLALLRLAWLLRRQRVTILHTHGARSNTYGAVAGRLARVPVIISTVHNSLLDYEVGELRRWFYLLARRLTIHLADRVICVSAALRQYVLDLFQTTPERTVTIYNGIDLSQFSPTQNGAIARAKFKVDDGPLLVAVGRLVTQKGQRYLLEALPYLIKEWPGLRCLMVGDGELYPELTALAIRLGVARHCHFAGVRSDMAEILAAADVVVLPSVSEGFPFVLLEALAVAKPVVASNVQSVYELIEDRKTGLLVQARNPEALAQGIREVLRNPAWAAQMGRQGQQVVRERFTIERMVRETVALFEEALRGAEQPVSSDKSAVTKSPVPLGGAWETVICPCGSPAPTRLVFRTPTRRYRECPDCSLVFLSPRPAAGAITEFYRDEYDQAYGRAESGPDRLPVFRSLYRHLKRHRMPPGRLLDVGCGDGHFLELCREAGWTCFGLELSREAVERGLRRGLTMLPHDWLGNWDRHPAGASPREPVQESEKERFDVIALINVLETVPDPVAILQRLRDALAPDGLMIIRVGNGAFHLPLRRPAAWLGARYQQAFHLFVYRPCTLRRLLKMTGLRILSVRNSHPSRGPVSGSTLARLGWRVGGIGLWGVAEAIYRVSGGQALWAPSFEVVAERTGGRP